MSTEMHDFTTSLEAFERLVEQFPDIDRKGNTSPYTSLNGHMFSYLAKDGTFGLRLPKQDREAFIAAHDSKLLEQHGSVMKEYVVVPFDVLADTATMRGYFRSSVTYIASLKPKPTARKKKK